MEKTDRELLIKEISSRLPYRVKVQVLGWKVPLRVYSINTDGYIYFESNDYDVDYAVVDNCLLYLRPMSSMTEEEQFQLGKLMGATSYNLLKGEYSSLKNLLEYSYKNHIDLFGLIPKGLALEASEDMYK